MLSPDFVGSIPKAGIFADLQSWFVARDVAGDDIFCGLSFQLRFLQPGFPSLFSPSPFLSFYQEHFKLPLWCVL